MGGAIFTLEGKTEKELRRKLEQRLTEARNIGLCEDGRTVVKFEPSKGKWVAYLALHT
jgi:hypothetical protein